jgi:hypothetical protein
LMLRCRQAASGRGSSWLSPHDTSSCTAQQARCSASKAGQRHWLGDAVLHTTLSRLG